MEDKALFLLHSQYDVDDTLAIQGTKAAAAIVLDINVLDSASRVNQSKIFDSMFVVKQYLNDYRNTYPSNLKKELYKCISFIISLKNEKIVGTNSWNNLWTCYVNTLWSLVTTNRIINVYGFIVVIMLLMYSVVVIMLLMYSVLHCLYSVGN